MGFKSLHLVLFFLSHEYRTQKNPILQKVYITISKGNIIDFEAICYVIWENS